MIKIEFKEAQRGLQLNDFYTDHVEFNYPDLTGIIKSVTFGCPSELVPSRSDILKKLGISRQKDQANQKKWNKLFQEQYKNV